MKSKIWILIVLGFLISISLILNTFASFETNAVGTMNSDIASFSIKLNGYNIGRGINQTFAVDNFIYSNNTNVESGYIAPGRSGYFDITLDASDVDVAFRYDIDFDLNSTGLNDNINFNVQNISGGRVQSLSDTTYYGIVSLDDIENNSEISLRINVLWADDIIYDENDTELGSKLDYKLMIPVNVYVIQYLGE